MEDTVKWAIVITHPDHLRPRVIGPFDTEADATFHEDRYLDPPQGSQATFVPMIHPADSATAWVAANPGHPDSQ